MQTGLESLLQPLRARGASEEEQKALIERVRSYYLSHQASSNVTASDSSAPSFPPENTINTESQSSSSGPNYPSSFVALASLIASGAPIPGIKQIPERINEAEGSKPKLAGQIPGAGRKPWEKSIESSASTSSSASPLNSSGEYMVFG